MSNLIVQDSSKTVCAWCLTPDELQQASEGESHGICDSHTEALLLPYYQRKFDAVPSYCERFARGEEEA